MENLRDSLVPLKLKALKLERIEDIPIELIPTIIFSIIAENDKTHVFNYLGYLLERKRDGYFFHKDIFDIPAYQFAKHLTFSRVVHVEQSPLELESIVNLVTKAS